MAPKSFVFRGQKLKAKLLRVDTGDGLFFFFPFAKKKSPLITSLSHLLPLLSHFKRRHLDLRKECIQHCEYLSKSSAFPFAREGYKCRLVAASAFMTPWTIPTSWVSMHFLLTGTPCLLKARSLSLCLLLPYCPHT